MTWKKTIGKPTGFSVQSENHALQNEKWAPHIINYVIALRSTAEKFSNKSRLLVNSYGTIFISVWVSGLLD